MQLKELASLIVTSRLSGDGEVTVTGIQTDSRKVQPGDLFICLPGTIQDGHQYAAEALAKGAAGLVAERALDVEAPVLTVNDSRAAMAILADHFYNYPSHEMKLIGITGTNGKTTTTFIIDKILTDYGKKTGLLGTIGIKIGQEIVPTQNTTPDAALLQASFRRMREVNTDYCVMEVSSHALDMGRVKGCRFRTALFTNLTQDHLDYHRTMDRYLAAKGLFFSRLGNHYSPLESERQYAILNADDPASAQLAHMTSAQIVTYGIEEEADVRASDIRITSAGTSFNLSTFCGEASIQLKLIGKFNVYNALGAIAATLVEGVPLNQLKNSLEEMEIVQGRMESIHEGQDFLVLVDFAHTPDGLENALTTISEFVEGRIITVFGCGGDRDRAKRPVMGGIAARYSDYVIATSDNPRSEEPERILDDIEPGMLDAGFTSSEYSKIADRREAIHMAIAMAQPNDVVLIAGKGHETYQIINGTTLHFDDREVAREAIRGLHRD
ncbi:UDP-N-acetylmuramoyl-L-alanyl-D-glutamate--2,6-diaminopimelate ligase [Paenibacillus sp. J2TS4]|uniref:UDP-N-acetylmuramoyl-L-alanyl-D-glutamate--2, 6-diaminopimelate ligase n=1 Tax=Paenibacillus sp. J2TS4 TaxID=2807194 RepID=UPI001B06F79D|nr:UDP-N-acetylmuramoyl-L-alanyl-D-glutamate--2,6-diaminopimelate ligase [Paenibacillus sp. J2TS4]GIP36387.1 UDP-N-acetylmuramoyl-L-alanyl-D-glutamate--2,6-diaminopimelate ligase [Paenibacillus sp. J2TS4]